MKPTCVGRQSVHLNQELGLDPLSGVVGSVGPVGHDRVDFVQENDARFLVSCEFEKNSNGLLRLALD